MTFLSKAVASLLFWMSLVYAFYAFVATVFSYEVTLVFDWGRAVVSLVHLAVAVSVIAYFDRPPYRPSRIGVAIIYIFLFIPYTAFYAFVSAPYWNLFIVFVFTVQLAVLTGWMSEMKFPNLDRAAVDFVFGGIFIVGLYVFAGLILQGGLNRLSLSFEDVYDLRREYLKQVSFPLSSYLVLWQANVINIALISYSIVMRHRIVALVGIVLQILIFAMTSFKSFLLGPFIAIFFIMFLRRKKIYETLSLSLAILTMFMVLLYKVYGMVLVPAVFIRRLFVTPSLMHNYYFDFFSQNPKVLLSNSVLSALFEYPYERAITRVISNEYYGIDFGANVGIVGDAYSNFGFIGVVIFSFILSFALKIADGMAGRVDGRLVVGVLVLPVMSLINSALFTTLMTHGLLLAILLVWVFGSASPRVGGHLSSRMRRKVVALPSHSTKNR